MMKKRIVSLLLAVIMVISLLPATVLAEEITFGDFFGLIGGQKFINSSNIVLSFEELSGNQIVTKFNSSMFTSTPKSNRVSVTSYGYHLVIRTGSGEENVFDFYVSDNAFTKVVVSGMERTERNDEYSPYNPAADYAAVTDALNECKALKASDYTSDSWQELQDAINGVIYNLGVDHQAEVDAMAKAIMDAIDALEASHTHDFTGVYKDNGNGTHSRKCTGCDEYDTAEAHSFTDGVCVCGAKDPDAELASAKEDAKKSIEDAVPADASDEMKDVAEKAKTAVEAAETMDKLTVALNDFSKAYGFLQEKENVINGGEAILRSDEYSDAYKALVQEVLDAIKAADSMDALQAVMDKYEPELGLQIAKDDACEEIERLLPDDASDAVKKIVSDACNEVQTNDDPDQYAEIIEAAGKAVDAQLLMEEELATLKDACSLDIDNAVPDDASDAVKELAEKAKAAIDAAETSEEVEAALDAGKEAIKKQIADEEVAAKEKAQYKEKITNKLLPAAKCDEAREILNKALTDLDNAETVSDMDSIVDNAEEAASNKDDEFIDCRFESNLYFKSALTDASSDETKTFVAEMEQAIADATSIAQVKDIFNSNKSKIDFYSDRDDAIASMNEIISSDESSEEMKAIVRECLSQVKTAATADEFHAILDAFEPQIQLQESKDEFIAQCNEMLTSDEYSDETKSLIRDMISEVKAAETKDELSVQAFKIGTILSFNEILTSDESSDELKNIAQKILDETMTASTAEECDAVMEKYAQDFQQQLEKDEARKEVKELLPENASDAVKKIVSDACDEIQANDDPDKYDDIIEAAAEAIEAQLQKEKELAPAKEAAIAEINDAKTDANASVAEEAVKAINNAQSEDEISALKEQALADMAATDAAAELTAAKEEAKAAIDNAVPADASDAVKAAAEEAKTAIDEAKSVEDVDAAKESGIAAIEDQIAADAAAAELAAAKKEAKVAILAEQGNDTSEAVAKAVEDALAAIEAATTVDEVSAAMEDGIAAIKDAKAGNVPPAPVTYSILDGANSVWTKGSTSGLVVRSDAPFAKFVGVKVDGKTIAATNYTAKEGSTIVTLTPAYLETLEVGTHSIEIVSTDGSASTNFAVKANSQTADSNDPQTGDSSMIYLWTLILVVSAAGLSATTIYSRKRKIK